MELLQSVRPSQPRTLALLIPLLATLGSSTPAQQVVDGIAAVVNGKVITESEIRASVETQERVLRVTERGNPDLPRMISELRGSAMDDLIDRELILAEFTKLGGQLKPEYINEDIQRLIVDEFKGDQNAFVRELANSNLTYRQFRELREKMLVVQYMRSMQTRNVPPATPQEVDRYYNENIDRFRGESAAYIYTITIPKIAASTTEEEQLALAEDLRQRIIKGADFAATARAYSQDSAAEDGGERGWKRREDLSPQAAQIVFNLKAGDVSTVVEVPSPFGTFYMIYYVEDIELGKVKPLAEVKGQVEILALQNKRQEAVNRWLERIRSGATIRKFGVGQP